MLKFFIETKTCQYFSVVENSCSRPQNECFFSSKDVKVNVDDAH